MRLSHVTLQASDVSKSRAFYLALGFEILVDEAHYCRFLTRKDEGPGDETLSIEHHVGDIRPAAQLGLEFPSPEMLDAFVEGLRLQGLVIADGPMDRSWLWRDARVLDPDGHEWMLFFAGKDKLDPPWRVKRKR